MPERHLQGVTIGDSPDSDKWKHAVKGLEGLIGSGFMLALLGGRGTGKTQAATITALLELKAERTVRYCKAMEIFLTIRATYHQENKTELDAIAEFTTPQCLVVDEIQQRGETAFEDRMLAYLMDVRYDAMVDTILIGNLTPEALQDSMDPSIIDRLRETGGVMRFDWGSFRAGKK